VTHTSVERNPVHCFSTVLSLCNSLALARSYRGRSLHQSLLRRVRYSFCIHQLLQQPLVQRRKRTPNLSLPLYLSVCLSVCLSVRPFRCFTPSASSTPVNSVAKAVRGRRRCGAVCGAYCDADVDSRAQTFVATALFLERFECLHHSSLLSSWPGGNDSDQLSTKGSWHGNSGVRTSDLYQQVLRRVARAPL